MTNICLTQSNFNTVHIITEVLRREVHNYFKFIINDVVFKVM